MLDRRVAGETVLVITGDGEQLMGLGGLTTIGVARPANLPRSLPSRDAVSTVAFAELFEQAGFPPGVVNTVTGLPGEVGEPLVSHPQIAKIAFTGGEPGGKSANIIFADASLENAARGAISGILAASGQTCIASSRLLAERRRILS